MPVTRSAIKKARQDTVARKRNRVLRDEYKKASKEVRKLILAGDIKKAKEALANAYSKIDKAAKKRVIHKNNASRRKSRLAALFASEKKEAIPKKTVKANK